MRRRRPYHLFAMGRESSLKYAFYLSELPKWTDWWILLSKYLVSRYLLP